MMKYFVLSLFIAVSSSPLFAKEGEASPSLFERVPGDVDANGDANLSDAIVLLRYLYLGDQTYQYEIEGEGRGYLNPRDDSINLNDVIYLINYLYRGGDAPIVTTRIPADTGRIHREIEGVGFTFEWNASRFIDIGWPKAFESPRSFRAVKIRLSSPDTGREVDLTNIEWTGQRSSRVAVPLRSEFAGSWKVRLIMEPISRLTYRRLPVTISGPTLDFPQISLEQYPVRWSPLFGGSRLIANVQDITGTTRLLENRVHPGGLFRVESLFPPGQQVSYLLLPETYMDSEVSIAPPNDQTFRGESVSNDGVLTFQAPSLEEGGPVFRLYVFSTRLNRPHLFANIGVIRIEEPADLCTPVEENRTFIAVGGVEYTDCSDDVSLPQPRMVAPGQTLQINTLSEDLRFDLTEGSIRVVLQEYRGSGISEDSEIPLIDVAVVDDGFVLQVTIPNMAHLAGREYGLFLFGERRGCRPWYACTGVLQVTTGGDVRGTNQVEIGTTDYRNYSRTAFLDTTVAQFMPGRDRVDIQSNRHFFDLTQENIVVTLTDPEDSSVRYSPDSLVTSEGGALRFTLPRVDSLRGKTFLVELFVYPHGEVVTILEGVARDGEYLYAKAGYLKVRE